MCVCVCVCVCVCDTADWTTTHRAFTSVGRDPVSKEVPHGAVPRMQQTISRVGVVGVELEQLDHGWVPTSGHREGVTMCVYVVCVCVCVRERERERDREKRERERERNKL